MWLATPELEGVFFGFLLPYGMESTDQALRCSFEKRKKEKNLSYFKRLAVV